MDFDAKYETGVLWQDFQHKQLIDLFTQVKEARASNKDQNLYRYTVAFLAMYVNHHFKLEEKYMEQYKYPGRKLHTKEHQDFVHELKEFRMDNKDYSPQAGDDLLMRMGEWILSHILEDDQKLGKHILNWEKTSGKS
ncbi:MAG: hemerythrin family protein [Proteobacteria bacterium]|nr:hemerythrin family protein [Pseudomonadota bacterium]MBU1386321.1 hemerythrin family protein [Pseudomonadota bacterium]MBU1543931.1 hemerythrin family protein [Pseudomonadota bacterium]MBU2482090.1 hemerythrin family protein [Pseudomonadota bacterium]